MDEQIGYLKKFSAEKNWSATAFRDRSDFSDHPAFNRAMRFALRFRTADDETSGPGVSPEPEGLFPGRDAVDEKDSFRAIFFDGSLD